MKFSRMQFHCTKMSQYFPKPFRSIKVKTDLSTKIDLKNVTHVDTSSFCTENKFL